MKEYEVIPRDASIRAGEIRVTLEMDGTIQLRKYSDCDSDTSELIGRMELFDYAKSDWGHFLRDIELTILEARIEPENVRIELILRDWFFME